MRVLLAVDASTGSKHAAEVVKHLADPPELHVLHVVDVWALKQPYLASEYSEEVFEAYRQEVSRLAQGVLHEIRDELAPHAREVRLVADSGDPAESIIHTAEEMQAELIVMGHRGMTGTSSFLLGGVSQKVATYAPCSVFISKGPMPVLDRILLAVDGSEESGKAADLVAACPFKPPVRVITVTVWSSPQQRGGGVASAPAAPSAEAAVAKARGEDVLRKMAERVGRGPYEAQIEWLSGDPPAALLESIDRHKVQIVVVGARGLRGIKRFLLGSVSQKVLMHAGCSVLIVR